MIRLKGTPVKIRYFNLVTIYDGNSTITFINHNSTNSQLTKIKHDKNSKVTEKVSNKG